MLWMLLNLNIHWKIDQFLWCLFTLSIIFCYIEISFSLITVCFFQLLRTVAQATAKRFSCPLCAKLYTAPASLQEHIRTHQGLYRCRCPECDKGFTSSKTMKEHLTSHTQINYFKCKLCESDFRYHYRLKYHMNQCHHCWHLWCEYQMSFFGY